DYYCQMWDTSGDLF
nr:immunoglobulin light chain junction region [Macaca mulatta]